jgi:hypothetical protein
LEGAAQQSDPVSRKVLEKAAREAKRHDRLAPPGPTRFVRTGCP